MSERVTVEEFEQAATSEDLDVLPLIEPGEAEDDEAVVYEYRSMFDE